jgi:hypothetical protein
MHSPPDFSRLSKIQAPSSNKTCLSFGRIATFASLLKASVKKDLPVFHRFIKKCENLTKIKRKNFF